MRATPCVAWPSRRPTATTSRAVEASPAQLSGTAAVNLSGVVDVVKVNTSAFIGKSAQVNCGSSCASNVASPDPNQSVRVAAGNQFHEIGVAASLAIAGTVGVGVGVGVHLVTLNTDATSTTSAKVNAAGKTSP